MKKTKRIAALLAALLLVVSVCAAANAQGAIETECEVSLTVRDSYDGSGLEGVTFSLYLVCTVDAAGEYTPVEAFAPFAERLALRGENDGAWSETAAALEQEVLFGTLTGLAPTDTAVTDSGGAAAFPSGGSRLTQGMYLVTGSRVERDGFVFSTAPFLVCLPGRSAEGNEWVYAVDACAKPDRTPVLCDLRVMKVWDDDCHASQRPASITVRLLCDGAPYGEPVTLPKDGQWEYTWKNLEMNHHWSVAEDAVEGYAEPEIRREGNTFILTNTCSKPDEPDTPPLPDTGLLWWPVPVLTALGLLCLVVGLLRRRGGRHEE